MDRSYKHLTAIKKAFLVAMEIKHNIAVPGRAGDGQLSSELRGNKWIGNYMILILYFLFIILEVLQAIAANYISLNVALTDVPWVSLPDLPFAFPVSSVHLYKCDARRESCGLCLKADPLFGCVWCKGENRCSLKQHCPHPQSMWLEHNGINSKCTHPRITKVKLCTNPHTK